ncbi:MAG: NAD(P)-binding domain-containing protein [Deltaproteobacteria bacterium]|nr:NAD(P)-binding domain-containing protein [Deltaproteobacteria bacterium]
MARATDRIARRVGLVGAVVLTLLPALVQAEAPEGTKAGSALGGWKPRLPDMVIEAETPEVDNSLLEAAYAAAPQAEGAAKKVDLGFTLAAAGILLVGFAWSYTKSRKLSQQNLARLVEAKEDGLDQPPTLHPHINLDKCIGCGNCTLACPDRSVLGLAGGHAHLINAANCVGHAICAKSCPVEAIELVFGTTERPVELPRLDERYESQVPGIYVAGELGGMGLIANAFDQAIETVDNVAQELKGEKRRDGGLKDLVIVGAGPAGLGAALRAHELGLSYACVDQESWGGAIRSYPRKKLVMTRPIHVPLYGPVRMKETSKEALVELWSKIVAETGVEITSETRVLGVTGQAGAFTVKTSRGELKARRVLLAIGRRGTPQKLNVPGDDRDNVAYTMLEPEAWKGKRVAVVGGGDVACETALALADQPDTKVTLLYRGEVLNRPKAANRQKVQAAVAAGKLRLLLKASPTAVSVHGLRLTVGGGPEQSLRADQIFVCIGGQPPTKFLTEMGVSTVTLRGEALAIAAERAAAESEAEAA